MILRKEIVYEMERGKETNEENKIKIEAESVLNQSQYHQTHGCDDYSIIKVMGMV